MAPYCAIPRDYLSDTPLLRAMGFLVSQHGQLGAIPPPPFLAFPPWSTCEVEVRYPPLKRGISAILPRYPMKTRQMGAIPPSAILSRKGIARYGGVSRTGPLRVWRCFDLLFGIEILLDLQFTGVRGPKKHAQVDPRKKTISMLNNRMQNLDTKKKRSRYQKADLGHLDTTKETSQYRKKTRPFR